MQQIRLEYLSLGNGIRHKGNPDDCVDIFDELGVSRPDDAQRWHSVNTGAAIWAVLDGSRVSKTSVL